MKGNAEIDLNADQVYDNYINLYMHLDSLRWNFIVGILALFYSVFSVLNDLFDKSKYFQSVLGIGFIIMSLIVHEYSRIISKFVKGQDFISLLLSDIEKRNNHIFINKIQAPEEKNGFNSFFCRREHSINNTSEHLTLSKLCKQLKKSLKYNLIKHSAKHEDLSLRDLCRIVKIACLDVYSYRNKLRLKNSKPGKRSRSSIIMNRLLSRGSIVLFMIGAIFILFDKFNISISVIKIIVISLGLIVICFI